MEYTEFIERYKFSYEIVKLKHEGNTYRAIGDQYKLSASSIAFKYRRFLYLLYKLYYQYLKSIDEKVKADDILEFYKDRAIAIAYVESEYEESLRLFRNNDPPLLLPFYDSIPCFKCLTERETASLEKYIVEAKERKNKSYKKIGNELNITGEKVRALYESYYHKKVLEAFKIIQPSTRFCLCKYYIIHSYRHPQVRWRVLASEYSNLLKDL